MITCCRTLQIKLFLVSIFVGVLFCLFSRPLMAALTQPTQSTHRVFVTIKKGDTLGLIFHKQGISAKTLDMLLKLPAAHQPMTHLHIGQSMRFTFNAKNELESFALALSAGKHATKTLVISRAGLRFTARTENAALRGPMDFQKIQKTIPISKKANIVKNIPAKISDKTTAKKIISPALHYTGMIIHTSLYNDAKKHHISAKLLTQVITIFDAQINFKDVHAGDTLILAYDNHDDIAAVKFTQGTRIFTAVRYTSPQGAVEYFTPNGDSMQKAFNRFPVKYTHINSLFNMHRMHPVTHEVRPHTGVDLAAPIGTPIYSIGEGKITFVGWSGAYGNMIKIQHDDQYASMYAHLLRFAPGLSVGSAIGRNQLIGFLGQTGNATGPHLHFEIRMHDTPVNPLTIPLPKASAVPRANINAFRVKANHLMIALNQYQKTL